MCEGEEEEKVEQGEEGGVPARASASMVVGE